MPMRSSVAPCVLPTGHRPNGRKVVCFHFSCTKSLFCILCLSGVFKLTTSAQFPTSEAESRAALLRGTPQTSRDRKMGPFLLISLKTWQHLAVLKSTHPTPGQQGTRLDSPSSCARPKWCSRFRPLVGKAPGASFHGAASSEQ